MKYTVYDCPGPEKYEVARFFWLEDALEYHITHGTTKVYYNGEYLCRIQQEDRMRFVQDPSEKVEYLNQLRELCDMRDQDEWKRTHPADWLVAREQPRSFGDPNWYPGGTGIAPAQYRQYVTSGDSVTRKPDTGEPSSIASM
jgi:hypothetical protein